MKVGIKFCGFCNPDFDANILFDQLKALTSDVAYVSYNDPEAKVIIYLSGCSKDCAAKEVIEKPGIVVAGGSVNYRTVPLENVVARICMELNKFIKGK